MADSFSRPWEHKIVENFAHFGSRGFIWDEGLGMPMRSRMVWNIGTYWLFLKLGDRMMALLSYLLLLAAIFGAVFWTFGAVTAVIVAVVLAGSPMIILNFSERFKPELAWYWLAIGGFSLCFHGYAVAGGAVWSLVAFCNVGASVLACLAGGAAVLVIGCEAGTADGFLLAALPGLFSHILRVVTAPGSKVKSNMLRIRRYTEKRPWVPGFDEILCQGPLVLAVSWAGVESGNLLGAAVLAINLFMLYYINWRIFEIDDFQSFETASLTAALSFCAAFATSPWSLAIIVIGAYRLRVMAFGYPVAEADRPAIWQTWLSQGSIKEPGQRWQAALGLAVPRLDAFPEIRPEPYARAPALMGLINSVEANSRVLLESHTFVIPYQSVLPNDYLRGLWTWSLWQWPRRTVELIGCEFTFFWNYRLGRKYLMQYNADTLTGAEMVAVADGLGASYIVVNSVTTLEALRLAGYQPAYVFDSNTLSEQERKLLFLQGQVLAVLRSPDPDQGIVSPATPWQRTGNVLTFEAKAGVTYRIKYQHHPHFEATLNGRPVEIGSYEPLPDVDLEFMTIAAAEDGRVELLYRDRFLGLTNTRAHLVSGRAVAAVAPLS